MFPRWYNRALILNIVVQSGIIITGAIVRVTGSGLGCPTWPDCVEGSLTPTAEQAEEWQKWVEFGNRLLTFVVGLVALVVFIGGLRYLARNSLKLLAATPILGTIAQALLGGVTVLTGLHPLTVLAHFMLSIIIVGFSVRLWFTAGSPIKSQDKLHRAVSFVFPIVTFFLIFAGTLVTGSGPHSGDPDVTHRLPFDLKTIAWFHADILWLFLGVLVALWVIAKFSNHQLSEPAMKWLRIVSFVTILQGTLGYVQYFAALPELLVILHVIGAVLVWNFVLRLSYELRYQRSKPYSKKNDG